MWSMLPAFAIIQPLKLFRKTNAWYIESYPRSTGDFPSNVTEMEVSHSIKMAIDTWGQHLQKVGYRFTQVHDYLVNDIQIYWLNGLLDERTHAVAGLKMGLGNYVVYFNDKDYSWIANDIPRTTTDREIQSIRGIMLHEFGHLLGFTHLYLNECSGRTSNPYFCAGPDIMVPFSGQDRDYFELSPVDLSRLYNKYNIPEGLDGEYKCEFNSALSDWIPIGGSWQIQNGRLIANYGIGCGSIWCPQSDLLLKDQFQPSGDWEVSVDFTYATDNYFNYGASGAAIIIWESPSKKIRISVGHGGSEPWGFNPETIMPVSFCAWDGTWDNSRWNYINYTWRPREWHTMTIDKAGNVYTVYVDDDYLWRYTDNYMNGTGKIGLQTYGPKTYDNFIIRTKD